jgi:hypothetical protein
MKIKYKLTVALLWVLAILSTLWVTRATNFFNDLSPLFFICMAGSVISVGLARHHSF